MAHRRITAGRPDARRSALLAATLMIAAGAAGARGETLPLPGGTTDPGQVRPGAYMLDSHHGRIAWSINHMGLSTYVGLVTGVEATLWLDPALVGRSRLSAQIDMSTIGTLYPPMDANLRGKQYFDVGRFPTARYESSEIRRTGRDTADIVGMLTMHGVDRPVVLHATFIQAGENPHKRIYQVGFQATATISRFDFGLDADPHFIGKWIDLSFEGEFQTVAAAGASAPAAP